MGYITIDVERDEMDHTWHFFYGEYIDEKWSARLADGKLQIIERFAAVNFEECFDQVADYLKDNVYVIGISGNNIERFYVDMLSDKLDVFLLPKLRPYF